MTDRNTIAFNGCERRREALSKVKMVDGKLTSYEKFIRGYLRSMSFTYQATGCDAKKYSKIMKMCESMGKHQWDILPTPTGELR